MTPRRLAISIAALVLAGHAASAQPDGNEPSGWRPARWSVTPLLGSDVGLDLGGGIQVEAPNRLRLMVNVGWLPEAYARVMKRYVNATQDVPEAMGELLEDLIRNAFLARANLSYRPLPRHGLFFGVGYTIMLASKTGLVADAIESATGAMLPAREGGTRRQFETSTRIHLLDGFIGWQWGLGHGFTLRATGGVMKVVHTTTSFSPAFTPNDPRAVAVFTSAASSKVENAGTSIIAPSGSLFAGYTF